MMRVSRSISTVLMLVALCGSLHLQLHAQSPFDDVYHEEALRIRERLELFTDRSLYMVNEPIRFRADYNLSGLQGIPWSDVLYMELVSPGGNAVARAKYSIEDKVSTGSLTVPNDTESGIYYLKCYTRWMRNRGPVSFTYLPVTIINPFRAELLPPANGHQNEISLDREPYLKDLLKISSPAASFKRSEEVRFTLSAPGNRFQETVRSCVTIVPLMSVDTLLRAHTGTGVGTGSSGFTLDYLPDLGGASIGGRVVQEDGSPGAYSTLHFTRFGNDPGYYVTSADDQGRFVLSTFGSTGTSEFFVAATPYRDQQVEVRIDQDYDQAAVSLPEQEFALEPEEKELATNMAIRMQLSRIYEDEPDDEPFETGPAEPDSVPFYGEPTFRLEMDEYVDLPYLDEIFENLVPMVKIIRRQGSRMMEVESDNSTISLYPPLVMVDYIPVFDQNAVLALISERSRKIEVIDEVFIRGNVKFGGVISIISRLGDMAGIDLPEGSYFFDFQTLEPPRAEAPPISLPEERQPDTRNTLLWLEDVLLEPGESAVIRCTMPDQPGEYVVLARSVLPGGEVQAATACFRVE